MSTLKRYRKPGGFKQLLFLLEASSKAKQHKLLDIIENEDENWAGLLEERILTFEHMLGWEGEHLEKVLSEIPEATWVKAICFLQGQERVEAFEKCTGYLPSGRKTILKEDFESMTPSTGEIEAAQLMIVKKLRSLQEAGIFTPERFAPLTDVKSLDSLVL